MIEKLGHSAASRAFSFGDFILFPGRQLLVKNGSPVRIGGRAFDILSVLVAQPGTLVSKRDLIARVWPSLVVEEGNLKAHMAGLRRILGEPPSGGSFIVTEVGRGYRFVTPVQTIESLASAAGPSDAARRGHNLPTGTTRIFGRSEAIEAIGHELANLRLVSIVGAGGTGKTTVALAVAEHTLGSFKDGVWWVDLALLKHADLVPHAIAAAVGLAAPADDVLATVCEFLRDRQMLLVIDNCEHLIDAAASNVSHILAGAAGIKMLVTSREPLQVKGERVRRLMGLGVPLASVELNAQDALAYPAVQLFQDRAADRLESFKLQDAEAPIVAEICRRLDGIALAIEFAATRVDAFGVAGLWKQLKQLDENFHLLSGRRAGPERHRTLVATLDWSYGLLGAEEAGLLRAVSVFAGGFDVAGASAVAQLAPATTTAALAQLAAKSLLATDVDAVDVAYRLLETTRSYCLERLQTSGESQAVRRRHAEHVCTVLERAGAEWAQRSAQAWAADYGPMLNDLRAALVFAGQDAADHLLLLRLTASGTLLWNHFSLTHEGHAHVVRALEVLPAAGLEGTSTEMTLQLSLAGATMFTRGIMPGALMALQRALALAVDLGSIEHQLYCLRMISSYQNFTGQYDAARHTLASFAALAATTDPAAVLEAQAHLGLAEIFVGRLQGVRQRLEPLFLEDRQEQQDTRFVRFQYDRKVDVGNVLSIAQWLTGSPDTAMRTALATVQRALNTRHGLSLSNALAVAACPIFFWRGQYEVCGQYVAQLEDHVRRHGIVTWRPIALFYRGALACAQHPTSFDGVDDIARAIAEFRAIYHAARMPFYLGVLAHAQGRCGRLHEAVTTMRAAHLQACKHNEQWCVPELLRIEAGLLMAEGRLGDAQNRLAASMALAHKISALSWQLRAATDLARLWRDQSRPDAARSTLLPVVSAFTEGFNTLDLTVAADLLAQL